MSLFFPFMPFLYPQHPHLPRLGGRLSEKCFQCSLVSLLIDSYQELVSEPHFPLKDPAKTQKY